MGWSYRPDLDGLRCIAVYLVLLFHSGLEAARGGFIGVDLFFVLSGFLVSNIILSEIDLTGRLSFSRFYARRVRRLLPAAVVVVVATSLVSLLVAPLVRRIPLVADAQSSLLYVANWHFLGQLNDYFATGVDKSPFLHYWSLSIEEQFYVGFPLLLVLLTRASRRWRGALPAAITVLLLLSLASQLYWARADANHAYYGTDARLYQLLAGAILAVVVRRLKRRAEARRHRAASPSFAGLLAWGGLAGVLLLGSGLIDLSPSSRGIAATAASAVLLAGLMPSPERGLRRQLARRTPVYLGRISYGTYLWHWPVILVLEELLRVPPVTVALLAIGISTGLAALSFEVLELPIRTAKALHRFSWPSVVTGVTTSALVAVTVVPTVLESEERPRLVQASVGASLDRGAAPRNDGAVLSASGPASGPAPSLAERRAHVPRHIDWRQILEDKGPMPTCAASDPQSCVVVRGHGPRVLLVGDSHARMLGPTFIRLARQHDFTLAMNVMPACPWQAGVLNLTQPLVNQEKCRSLRQTWYQQVLPKLHPDLVVLAGIGRDDPRAWQGRLVPDGGPPRESLGQLNLSTTLDTVKTFVDQGSRVLIVDNLMGTGGFNPLDCLSVAKRLDQCQVTAPGVAPVSDAYYRIAADRFRGVYTVDLNKVLCVGYPQCMPVVDHIVVWKNHNHFNTMYLDHQRAKIYRAIEATGALSGL